MIKCSLEQSQPMHEIPQIVADICENCGLILGRNGKLIGQPFVFIPKKCIVCGSTVKGIVYIEGEGNIKMFNVHAKHVRKVIEKIAEQRETLINLQKEIWAMKNEPQP